MVAKCNKNVTCRRAAAPSAAVTSCLHKHQTTDAHTHITTLSRARRFLPREGKLAGPIKGPHSPESRQARRESNGELSQVCKIRGALTSVAEEEEKRDDKSRNTQFFS